MSFRSELARKSIHLGSAVCPLIYALTNRTFALCLAVPVTFLFIVIDLLRRNHRAARRLYDRYLGYMMRDHEQRRFCGATYVMIAVTLSVLLFTQRVAGAALLMMSVSDALASLVGMKARGPRWFGKSLAGSAAFFVSAAVIALLCLPHRPLAALCGAAVATLAEAVPFQIGRLRIDDNLVVPLAAGAVMTLLPPAL